MTWEEFLIFDLPALTTTLSAAIACALVGSFLLLKRNAMMGDAISHSVLPGIVVAFLLSGSRASWNVFLGALFSALFAAILVNVIQKLGRVEKGAAMGVVFTTFFALGVLLIEQAAARNVDLDAECLLHGQLETIFWYPPKLSDGESWLSAMSRMDIGQIVPVEVQKSLAVLLVVLLTIGILFKELRLAAFDYQFAQSLGLRPALLDLLLFSLAALAVVSSFEVVGSILVIAMLVVPGATARLLCDRLHSHLLVSTACAILAVLLGYYGAVFLPILFGGTEAVSAAGMIAVMSGALFVVALFLAPRHGIVSRFIMLFRSRKLRQT